MKVFFKIALLLFLSSFSLYAASNLQHANSYTDALKKGVKENKHVVLFTHSPFCPWCRKMEKDTLSHLDVIKLLNEKYIFLSADITLSDELKGIPQKFIPRGTPTTFIIDPHTQKELFTMPGYISLKKFLWRLQK